MSAHCRKLIVDPSPVAARHSGRDIGFGGADLRDQRRMRVRIPD
jgi:hypothetical protein